MTRGGSAELVVEFAQPPAVVFTYLADPRNRPAWQSSLRRIDGLTGEGLGSSWYDVTMTGARPRMVVTEHEPDRSWAETGSWHGLEAALRLVLEPSGPGTRVRATFAVSTRRNSLRPLALVLDRVAPPAVRSDLRRAARLLDAG